MWSRYGAGWILPATRPPPNVNEPRMGPVHEGGGLSRWPSGYGKACDSPMKHRADPLVIADIYLATRESCAGHTECSVDCRGSGIEGWSRNGKCVSVADRKRDEDEQCRDQNDPCEHLPNPHFDRFSITPSMPAWSAGCMKRVWSSYGGRHRGVLSRDFARNRFHGKRSLRSGCDDSGPCGCGRREGDACHDDGHPRDHPHIHRLR